MALHAHELDVAVEVAEVGGHGDARLAGLLPIADRGVEHEALVPGDEGVAQERGDVVAERTVERVLEVEDAGHRIGDHQVARHEVAVHEDEGLAAVGVENGLGGHPPPLLLLLGPLDAAVAAHVPGREELELALQDLAAVGGKHVRAGDLLPRDERRGGTVHEFAGVVLVEDVKIGLPAEVGEQHEAMVRVGFEDFGGVEARLVPQQAVDLDEGSEALGRLALGIHGDEAAAVGGGNAVIGPEASVRACTAYRRQIELIFRGNALEPLPEGGGGRAVRHVFVVL